MYRAVVYNIIQYRNHTCSIGSVKQGHRNKSSRNVSHSHNFILLQLYWLLAEWIYNIYYTDSVKGARTPPTQFFLLMVAMHDYYYCILTWASPLQHKDKVPAEGAAH